MATVERHLAWLRVETGAWIGEWSGSLPFPVVPPFLVGDARMVLMNEWLHRAQRGITPYGSPHPVSEEAWDRDAWEDCPPGGAVCLDVTMYGWPVGDFRWSCFDGTDRVVDFRDVRTYLEVSTETAQLDINLRSARQCLPTPTKLIADVTGTPMADLFGRLHGQLVRRDGRFVFLPSFEVPEAVVALLTDRNCDVEGITRTLDPERVPVHEE